MSRTTTQQGYVWAVSSGDQIHVDGSTSGGSPPSRGWLMLTVGLAVGVAAGVLFTQPSSSSGPRGESMPADSTTSTSIGVTNVSSTSATTVSEDVEALRSRIDELQEELTLVEERLFELGLEVDPASYAFALECGDGVGVAPGGFVDSYFVGPVAFLNLVENLAGMQAFAEVFATVERADSVTLVVPASERDRYSLLWNPSTWRSDGVYVVATGEPAVTLPGCQNRSSTFIGGFVTSEAYCAPLDVYFADDPDPHRVMLPFGGLDCPEVSVTLKRPEPGPIPDIVGLTLRGARLAWRLVAADPVVNNGEPVGPDSMVWAQEPNSGATYEPGAVVGLRTCQPADEVVATYQERLDDIGVTLSAAWMAPVQTPDFNSWWFISALVAGGDFDNGVATWGLPVFAGALFPANAVAEGVSFGDGRITPEDFGLENWLDLGGAVASQRCVEASTPGPTTN